MLVALAMCALRAMCRFAECVACGHEAQPPHWSEATTLCGSTSHFA